MKVLALVLCLLFASCSTLQTKPALQDSLELTGYSAALGVLKNNPKYIPIVETSVKAALERTESPTVDVASLLKEIREYCIDMQAKMPNDAWFVLPIVYKVEQMERLNLAVPEQAQKVLGQLKSLFVGIKDGVRDVKLFVKSDVTLRPSIVEVM